MRTLLPAVVLVGLASAGCGPDEADRGREASLLEGAELPCAPGTNCLKVRRNGRPDPEGDRIAQCAGTFPDFIVPAALFPPDYAGPWFALAQKFPEEPPSPSELPWKDIDFAGGVDEANRYLYALRDYAFEGMIEADFRPQENPVRPWYHVPLMNFHNGRELVHGVTEERPLGPGELGLKRTVRNFAVGFYNDIGAYTIGRVFERPNDPDISQGRFREGAMVFKILFSAATPEDFEDPSQYLLEGAPEWRIAAGAMNEDTGEVELTPVRLLQMDVAVRDDRAEPTRWVFGTFAFDKGAGDAAAWKRLRPVGLMWGNDPGYTPADQQAGRPLRESIVSDEIPAYAATHLGWAGRVNGPVDNPASSCLSCHQTAQIPVAAALLPLPPRCDTDEKRLYWFRNLAHGETFGAVDRGTCEPVPPPASLVSLDFSLQLMGALQSLSQFHDVNPCLGEPPTEAAPMTEFPAAPRVER